MRRWTPPGRHRLTAALGVAVLAALVATPVAAQEPPADREPAPGTPACVERELGNSAHALGRQADQLSNPEFAAAFVPGTVSTFAEGLARQLSQPLSPIVTLAQLVPGGRTADPFRIGWAEEARGFQTPISFENRHGATIRGSLWAAACSAATCSGRPGATGMPAPVCRSSSGRTSSRAPRTRSRGCCRPATRCGAWSTPNASGWRATASAARR